MFGGTRDTIKEIMTSWDLELKDTQKFMTNYDSNYNTARGHKSNLVSPKSPLLIRKKTKSKLKRRKYRNVVN